MAAAKRKPLRSLTNASIRKLVGSKSREPAPGSFVPLVEPIWSYWLDVGCLAAVTTALALRQADDPRALQGIPKLDLPAEIGGALTTWLHDHRDGQRASARETNYLAHYGLRLFGGKQRIAPSAFLDGFHDVLVAAVQQNQAQRALNGLRLAHLLRRAHFKLARSASSIVDGLPHAQVFPRLRETLLLGRADLLIAQRLLAEPRIRSGLGGFTLVPYPEPWMGSMDRLRQVTGSMDSLSVFHHDLAVTSEALVLSIRHGDWTNAPATSATRWASFWQLEIARYLVAYQEVTGVRLDS
jgi:hypothetical protein